MLERGLGGGSDKTNANANAKDIRHEIFATTIKVIKRNKEILRNKKKTSKRCGNAKGIVKQFATSLLQIKMQN